MNLPAFLMGCPVLPEYLLKFLTPLSTLHKQGHITVAHLDDLYLQELTYEKCVQNVVGTTVLLEKLGLVVHPEKSTFIPTQVLTILGFAIDSVEIQLISEKATSLQNVCTALLQNSSPSIRKVASVIGKIVASFPGVIHGALYYRYLEKDKSQALIRTKGNFDDFMSLFPHAKSELQWWIRHVGNTYNVINHPQPQHQNQMLPLWVGGQNLQGCPQEEIGPIQSLNTTSTIWKCWLFCWGCKLLLKTSATPISE